MSSQRPASEVPPAASPSLLSRHGELERLRDFLATGADAGVRCLLLFGEPGIGKTALWEAGVERAATLGYNVLSARASEAETGLSFAALGDLVDGVPAEALGALPAPQLRAIEVALRRADAGDEPPDVLAISAGFFTALRGLAEHGPLLVAVDDTQWLDPASAEVLTFAARRLTAGATLFLLSRRSGRATSLERALGPGGVARVEVVPLSSGAIARLLSERLGLVVPRRVLRQLYETSQGNPLFALELGRLVAEHGLPDAGAELPFPHLVGEAFRERVHELAPPVRRAVLAVALSARLARSELTAIADPLTVEDAEAADLIVTDRGRLRLSHPLLAAAARHQSSARERRELHLDLASAVADPAGRARHLAAGTSTPDAVLAQTVAEAAQLAAERGAAAEAEELAREALRLTPRGDPELPQRVLSLARRQIAVGDYGRAGDLLTAHLEELPPGRARARARLTLALVAPLGDDFRHLELALAQAGGDREIRAEALLHESMLLSIGSVRQIELAESKAREALAAVRGARPEVEARAWLSLAWSLVMQGRAIDELPSTVPLKGDMAIVERSLDRPRAVRLAFRGETANARQVFERLREEAEAAGDVRSLIPLHVQLCELDLRCGDVPAAAAHLEELDQWGDLDQLASLRARLRANLAAVTGRSDAARDWAASVFVSGAAQANWDLMEVARVRGLAALYDRDTPRAVAELQSVWDRTRRERVGEPGAFPVAPDLVEALLQGGDGEAAAEVTADLRATAVEQQHPWGLATSARCEAAIELQQRFDEDAVAMLETAAARYGELGLLFDRARSLLLLGGAARRHKKSGVARRCLEEAVAGFEGIGCAGWAERGREELARVSGRRPRAADGLTPSERQVVELAADGLSNKEIAGRLVVSVYTVEQHLSRAYAKLGVRSRTQLARFIGS